MRLACTVTRLPGGWMASHSSRDAGQIEVRALTRNEVIEKIKGEIRYRLELCPCTGDTYQHIEIDVTESPARA